MRKKKKKIKKKESHSHSDRSEGDDGYDFMTHSHKCYWIGGIDVALKQYEGESMHTRILGLLITRFVFYASGLFLNHGLVSN